MSKRDYYDVLGVAKTADAAAIKSAYRQLALKNHPDRNPGDSAAEERFKEAAEAYSILADDDKRRRYDRFGHAGVSGQAGRPDMDPTIFADFGDIFGGLGDAFGLGDLFGGGRRSGPARGADLRYDLTIPFSEAASGVETTLQIPRLETCDRCDGRQSEPGSQPERCTQCGGHGQVRYQQGILTVARPCPQCRGAGKIIKNPCTNCRGQGRVETTRKLTVKIPAGIDSGQRLRIQGEGEHGGRGGPAGDLYVVIDVEAHPFFERDGDDLWCQVPVSFPTLALGATITIPTLEGDEELSVPKGTQPDAKLRVANRGMPSLSGRGRGHLYVTVQVQVPTSLSRTQRELLEQLDETMPDKFSAPTSPTPDRGDGGDDRPFFDRVRDIFG